MTRYSKWLPAGGGEMGERIRAFDWDSHPLGSPQYWPTALHVALGICLRSSFPTAIYWGRDLWLLYNDAWSSVPRDRHPAALGQSGSELWTDIWEVVGPQFESVLNDAESHTSYDQMLPIERDGQAEETYWNYSLSPIIGEDGTVVGVFNQGHETTAKVMAARERQAETRRLRDLFAQAPGAVAVLSGANHVFEIANAAYLDLIDHDESVVGKPVAEALPEVVGQGFVSLLDKVYASGEPFIGNAIPVELIRHGEREQRIVDFVYQPTRDMAGEVDGIFVEAWDVTEPTRLLEQLRELNSTLEKRVQQEVDERLHAEEQLRQSQKMEAIGQLTGGIAHDFNNMLAVVISAMSLLKRRLPEDDTTLNRYVDAAAESAERAAELTRRLLTFSRQQPLLSSAVDTNEMMASMTDLLKRTLGENISIETAFGPDVGHIHVDPVQLESAILNLAVNARDAMPDGGTLSIETRSHDEGRQVVIVLTDSGSGMSQETMDRAFEPFFTTKDVGRGTGLGLSQVFGFARQSSGEVKIRSAIGDGTSVEMRLPRCEPGAVDPVLAATHDLARARPGETVMIVEDDDAVRRFSTEALEELGYGTISAANGDDALTLMRGGKMPSLLFTDVVMPEMSGPQLVEKARQLNPELRVLFTTGYVRTSIDESRKLENADLIRKPFTLEQLAPKLRAVLDG